MVAPVASNFARPEICLHPKALALRLSSSSDPIAFGPPVLAATDAEWPLIVQAPASRTQGTLHLFENEDLLFGFWSAEAQFPLEDQTYAVYQDILDLEHQGWNLHRVWNFIPFINENTEGLENYRSFCIGRSRAFEEHFGATSMIRMPAASGVGNSLSRLSVLFACGRGQPLHLENPLQTPAYRYPKTYGPRSPSFSRATIAGIHAFISGTASIIGHASAGVDDLQRQLEITCSNICTMINHIKMARFPVDEAARHYVVYIRHPEDLPAVATFLNSQILKPGDHVCYLEADVCRQELLVEIELTLSLNGR